jgi:hypothetical protein
MSSKRKQAQWWQLYAMMPLLVGLFLLELRLHLNGAENVMAQLGILLLVYGLIHLWIRANAEALMEPDERLDENPYEMPGKWRIRTYEFSPTDTPGFDKDARPAQPVFHFPETGLKGVLSTTFEMDELEENGTFPTLPEVPYSEEVFNTQDGEKAKV